MCVVCVWQNVCGCGVGMCVCGCAWCVVSERVYQWGWVQSEYTSDMGISMSMVSMVIVQWEEV